MLDSERPDDLHAILDAVKSGKALTSSEQDRFLNQLESYECWTPFLELISRKLKNKHERRIEDYARLARIQCYQLDDVDSAAEVCAKAVSDLGISYDDFRQSILSSVLDLNDFGIEARILSAIFSFLEGLDRIDCLERLCLIYEKKKFDEHLLAENYNKLYALDNSNQKALRYFKMVQTQNGKWSEVTEILEKMYASSQHINDKFRIAQELATVYLYQLGDAKKAVEILQSRCSKSPLDTTTVEFEAYFQLGDWSDCLRVLKSFQLESTGKEGKAVILFKMAELEVKLGKLADSEAHLLEALSYDPHFIDAFELLIEINILQNSWYDCLENLEKLKKAVANTELSARLGEAMTRLAQGLGRDYST